VKGVDFGKAAGDYARHRAGFPPSLFERLAALGVGLPGQRVLDLGTGTGTLARGFAERGAEVTGLDVAQPILDEAARLADERGLRVRWLRGRAEDTGLDGGAFDIVSAGQCWHWFDRVRAAAEVRRLLAPGGAFVVAYLDWISLPGSIADATETMMERANAEWKWRGWSSGNLRWLDDAALAGFACREAFAYDVEVPYSHESWRGRVRASAGIGASLPPDAVQRFDDSLRQMLAERFPADPFVVTHRVFAMIAR